MKIAQRIREEHMHPLTANLVEYDAYLGTVENNFPDMTRSDHAFLVMVEWRRRLRNERKNATAEKIVEVLKAANIDHHLVCLVRI